MEMIRLWEKNGQCGKWSSFCCAMDNEDDFRVMWLEALKDMQLSRYTE